MNRCSSPILTIIHGVGQESKVVGSLDLGMFVVNMSSEGRRRNHARK